MADKQTKPLGSRKKQPSITRKYCIDRYVAFLMRGALCLVGLVGRAFYVQ
jgi:hypothetical protein